MQKWQVCLTFCSYVLDKLFPAVITFVKIFILVSVWAINLMSLFWSISSTSLDGTQWLIQKIPKGGAPNLWFSQTVGGGGFVSRVVWCTSSWPQLSDYDIFHLVHKGGRPPLYEPLRDSIFNCLDVWSSLTASCAHDIDGQWSGGSAHCTCALYIVHCTLSQKSDDKTRLHWEENREQMVPPLEPSVSRNTTKFSDFRIGFQDRSRFSNMHRQN